MAKGTIKWFNKEQGFGFIAPDEGGRDIYIQTAQIDDPEQILDGGRVEYELVMGRKGPEAIHVKALG